MWALPSMKNSWGCIILAVMPGVFLPMNLNGSGSSTPAYAFMGQAILGYQKSWGIFSLFVQARYAYVMIDKKNSLMSVGGEVGFGLNAW
jgi:hypothetical protein